VLLAFDSPTAHTAIMLRAKGIPTVVAAEEMAAFGDEARAEFARLADEYRGMI
jgi:phosphoenolpyruvate-protein kinase (PTS system EI component)